MNLLLDAIIEGFGRAIGRHLYRFTRSSLGLTGPADNAQDWPDPESLDGDDGDDGGDDGDDGGDADPGA